jgi:hypothetical protein
MGAGGPASGIGVRPGVGAGGVGVGSSPGVGRPGVGPYGGAAAGAYGAGYHPYGGAAAGAYGAGYHPYGSYYAGDAALAAHGSAFYAGGWGYPSYGAAMFAAYPGAWPATNMSGASLYANPGYGALAGQLGMGQPANYDYGGNVVAQPDAVYVNGDNVGTPQQYADQASQLAATGRNAQPDPNTKWQPLGVFAMVEGNQTSSDDVFQIAVDPKGILRGNYHNTKTNSVVPIAGAVDPKTQRAAWTIGGDQSPVYEAGIANLTKDQTTMVLHTSDGQQRQFTLIRLPDPSQARPGDNSAAPSQS